MTRRARLNLSVIAALLILLIVLAAMFYPQPGSQRVHARSDTTRVATARAVRRESGARAIAPTQLPSLQAPGTSTPRPARIEHLEELKRRPEQDRVLWNAEERLVAECMKERGFAYEPNPPDRRADEEVAYTRVPRGDSDAARAVGYGIHMSLLQGEQPKQDIDANAEQLAAMPPERQRAFREALLGPPVNPTEPEMAPLVDSIALPDGTGAVHFYRDACVARARRALYGTDYEHNEAGFGRQALRKELERAVESDPVYQQAEAKWSACMQARGFSFAHPGEPRQQLVEQFNQGRLDADGLQRRELELASTDATCDQRAGLEAAREAVQERADRALTRAQQEKLQMMRAEQDGALSRARALLDEEEQREAP